MKERKIISLGSVFQRWTVIQGPFYENRKARYICKCVCGKEKSVYACHLLSGQSKSCGCLCIESIKNTKTTHGMSHSKEYGIWRSMIDRCHRELNHAYARYGGRGIFVCDEWRNSFESFISHVGMRPSKNHSIDRIDNDKGYFPGNCRWATVEQQSTNKRKEKNNSSGFVGVTATKNNKWMARIYVNKKVIYIGTFEEKDSAIYARLKAEKTMWKDQ